MILTRVLDASDIVTLSAAKPTGGCRFMSF